MYKGGDFITYGNIVIFDYEVEYATKLADYITNKNKKYLIIKVFTNIKYLNDYILENKVEILIICEDVPEAIFKNNNILNFLVLAERKIRSDEIRVKYLYKYQSAENILSAIFDIIKSSNESGINIISGETERTIIGVFSPLENLSFLSFLIAKFYSDISRSLLIDFNFFSPYWNNEKKGLSDLFYYIRQNDSNIMLKVLSLYSDSDNLNIISSIQRYRDLTDLNSNDINVLFNILDNYMEHRYIIFNLGYFDENIITIMENCDVIYLAGREDGFVEGRNIFYDLMDKEGLENIKSKCVEAIISHEFQKPDENEISSQWKLYIKELVNYE